MNRTIKINLGGDGAIFDLIEPGSARPCDVDIMLGDPILRVRMNRMLARDCARRRLLWKLLPAVNKSGREAICKEIDSWNDPEVEAVANEILELAGWQTRIREEHRKQILGPDNGRIT